MKLGGGGAGAARFGAAGPPMGARPQPLAGRSSRFVLEPKASLSASLPNRLPSQQLVGAASSVDRAAPPPLGGSAPLPPLEPPPQPPLELLLRARDLSAQLDRSSPLCMQVLRQLRAQYAKASDQQGMRACEAQIDQLHKEEVERRVAEVAALEVSERAEGGGSSASASGAGTEDDGPSKPEQVLV